MIQEIRQNIYRIEQVLPNNPLRFLNVYFIKTNNKHLLIDLGFNKPECEKILREAFKELGVMPKDIDVFITHAHVDHLGCLDRFYGEFNRILAGPVTAKEMHDYINKTIDVMTFNSDLGGIPQKERVNMNCTLAHTVGIAKEHKVVPVSIGKLLHYGDYSFRVIDFKGHTRGQVGLYELKDKFLFSGDHILNEISPNICFWGEDFDALGYYLYHLKQLKKMPISIIYPAHRGELQNINERVDELLIHHKQRLDEMEDLFQDAGYTAYDLAKKLSWNFKDGNFNHFPILQKWFATSEVLAHLEYLFNKQILIRNKVKGIYYYQKNRQYTQLVG